VRPFDSTVADEYAAAGYWDDEPLAARIATLALSTPDATAFVDESARLSWEAYDRRSTELARALVGAGLEPDDRIGVLLPDGPDVHVAYVAAEKAGAIVVGIGPRSRANEIHHLLEVAGCTTLLTAQGHRGAPTAELVEELRRRGCAIDRHLVLDPLGGPPALDGARVAEAPDDVLVGRALGPDDLFFVNSTSGTTGLPKCVMQTQNRWKYFHKLAIEAGDFTDDDVFMSLIPAPFGFGLWTAHFSPTLLGVPTVLTSEFDVSRVLELVERERPTVLACVTTQFVMMLNSPDLDRRDVSSLRCMFTGGEAVPYARSAEFEDRTGCLVLQFYGSNESGAVSRTTLRDSRDQRLRTAGRTVAEMNVRVLDETGADVTGTGRTGLCVAKGPAMTPGYFADEDANRILFRDDGWLVTGDLVTVDAEAYLSVVGRVSDIVIRGGQNISAPAVEEVVAEHPRVAIVGVVGAPDEVFGERVCAFVETTDDAPLDRDELAAFLDARGVSKYLWPELVVVLPDLPRATGGKIDKGSLRRLVEVAGATPSPVDIG
jgi:acyl-CoA synthetase